MCRCIALHHSNNFIDRTMILCNETSVVTLSTENTWLIPFSLASCKISYSFCSHNMGNTFPTFMAFSNLSIDFISLFVKRDKNDILKKKKPKSTCKIPHCWIGYLVYSIWVTIFSWERENVVPTACITLLVKHSSIQFINSNTRIWH